MIRIAILTTLISFAQQQVFGQKLDFKVIDYASDRPLDNVEVFSHEEHNKVSFTDKQGLVNFDVDHTDTLVFFKQGYVPLYIQVHRVNFDHSHALVLQMKASNSAHARTPSHAFDDLTKSKYHFVHDSLDNSSMQITHFELPEITATRSSSDKSFHIAQVGLDKKSSSRNSAYKAKED